MCFQRGNVVVFDSLDDNDIMNQLHDIEILRVYEPASGEQVRTVGNSTNITINGISFETYDSSTGVIFDSIGQVPWEDIEKLARLTNESL